ncbi:MAG: hypothetical protein ACOYXT_06885 [Bacteroidota bacterium]
MNLKALIITGRVQWIILIALTMMWLAPWGSFDPTSVGFYVAIVFALVSELSFMRFMKFPPEDKMNFKVLVIGWRIQLAILIALTLMWLAPWGSFDPTTLGFYASIALAIISDLILIRFMKFPAKNK